EVVDAAGLRQGRPAEAVEGLRVLVHGVGEVGAVDRRRRDGYGGRDQDVPGRLAGGGAAAGLVETVERLEVLAQRRREAIADILDDERLVRRRVCHDAVAV